MVQRPQPPFHFFPVRVKHLWILFVLRLKHEAQISEGDSHTTFSSSGYFFTSALGIVFYVPLLTVKRARAWIVACFCFFVLLPSYAVTVDLFILLKKLHSSCQFILFLRLLRLFWRFEEKCVCWKKVFPVRSADFTRHLICFSIFCPVFYEMKLEKCCKMRKTKRNQWLKSWANVTVRIILCIYFL